MPVHILDATTATLMQMGVARTRAPSATMRGGGMSDQAHLSALDDLEDRTCSLKSMAEIVVILMERSESGIALVRKTNVNVQQAVTQIEMEPLTFAVQLNSIAIALKREFTTRRMRLRPDCKRMPELVPGIIAVGFIN